MGGTRAWALAWFLAAALSALLTQANPAQGDELLVNGGFEDALGGEWVVTSSDDALDRVQSPDGPVHSGSYAAKLTCQGWEPCRAVQSVDAAGYGQMYELRGYVALGETDGELHLWLRWLNGSGEEVGKAGADSDCTVDDDEPYRCLTTGLQASPPAAHRVRVMVELIPANETQIIYLDDFSLSGPPAPTPTSPPPETPSPTATPTPTATPQPTAVRTPTAEPPGSSPPRPSPTASSRSATPLPLATLINGGFEEADEEGKPLGWRKYGGELARSSAARWEGRFAAAFTSRTASTKWVFQTVAVEGGKAYLLDGYALKNDPDVQAAYLRLSWYASPDGSGPAINSVDSTVRLTDDSPDFRFLTTGPVVAPAEAASAKVRLMLDPLSEAVGLVYFDSISFSETTMPPEPTATALPPPGAEGLPTAVATAPVAPGGEGGLSPSPVEPPRRPSPTVLAAESGRPEVTPSPPSQPSPSPGAEGKPTATPLLLYRQRKDSSSPEGEGVATAGSEGGISPLLLVLATALPAAAAAGAGSWVWWQRRRARPL